MSPVATARQPERAIAFSQTFSTINPYWDSAGQGTRAKPKGTRGKEGHMPSSGRRKFEPYPSPDEAIALIRRGDAVPIRNALGNQHGVSVFRKVVREMERGARSAAAVLVENAIGRQRAEEVLS